MKKLSSATTSDFALLSDSTKDLSGFDSVEELAQAFVDMVFGRAKRGQATFRGIYQAEIRLEK